MLTNKTYPDRGNKLWVLLNISRSHSKNNYKVSPVLINHRQRSLWTTINDQCQKILKMKHLYQPRQEKIKTKHSYIYLTKMKNIFWPYWIFYSSTRQREQLHTVFLKLRYIQHPHHTTQKQNWNLLTEWYNKKSWQMEKAEINTKTKHNGQWSIRGPKTILLENRHAVTIITTTHA